MKRYSLSDIKDVGAKIAAILKPGDAIALSGELGAGKTSLARAILSALGHEGEAPSPTFAIIQPYEPPEVRVPVLHCDLYRLDDPSEVLELGLDDARHDSVLIIEWAERMGPYAWPDMLWLTIEFAGEGSRRLTATLPAAWESRWPFP